MKIKQKLKSQSGFTLAETLLAVLILLLVSVIVANGIPAAQNVYNNVIIGSNAQVLLSTATTALRNELGIAQDVQSDGTTIVYYNPSRKAYSQINRGNTGSPIRLLPYVSVDPITHAVTLLPGAEERDLVSNAASNKNLYVTYASVALDSKSPDVIVFTDIEVKKINDKSNTVLTSLDELKIRVSPIGA